MTGFADFLMWSDKAASNSTYKHNGLELDNSRVQKNWEYVFFTSYIKKPLDILSKNNSNDNDNKHICGFPEFLKFFLRHISPIPICTRNNSLIPDTNSSGSLKK